MNAKTFLDKFFSDKDNHFSFARVFILIILFVYAYTAIQLINNNLCNKDSIRELSYYTGAVGFIVLMFSGKLNVEKISNAISNAIKNIKGK